MAITIPTVAYPNVGFEPFYEVVHWNKIRKEQVFYSKCIVPEDSLSIEAYPLLLYNLHNFQDILECSWSNKIIRQKLHGSKEY